MKQTLHYSLSPYGYVPPLLVCKQGAKVISIQSGCVNLRILRSKKAFDSACFFALNNAR